MVKVKESIPGSKFGLPIHIPSFYGLSSQQVNDDILIMKNELKTRKLSSDITPRPSKRARIVARAMNIVTISNQFGSTTGKLRSALNMVRNNNDNLEIDIIVKEKVLKHLTDTKEELTENLLELNNTHDELGKDVEPLLQIKNIDAFHNELKQKVMVLSQTGTSISNDISSIRTLKEKVESLDPRYKNMEMEYLDRDRRVSSAQNLFTTFQTDDICDVFIDKWEFYIKALEDIRLLTEYLKEMTTQVDNLKQEVQSVKQDLESSTETRESLHTELNSLLTTLKEDIEGIVNRKISIKNMKKEISVLESSVEKKNMEYEYRKVLLESEDILDDYLEARLTSCQFRIDELKKSLNSEIDTNQTLAAEHCLLMDNYNSLSASNTKMNTFIIRNKDNFKQLKASNHELRKKQASLQNQLNNLKSSSGSDSKSAGRFSRKR